MMTDDKNNIMSDDEYKLPKDEYLSSDEVHASSEEPLLHEDVVEGESVQKPGLTDRFPILKNKRFIIGVSVVVVVFAAYQIMRPHDTVKPVKPIVEHTVKTVVQKPSTRVLGQLNSLQASQVDNSQTVSDLKNQVSSLSSQLTAASNQNAALNNTVSQLTAQVKLLSRAVVENAHQIAAAKVPKKVAHKKPAYVPPKITYAVKAVVPGRAWVVDSNGQSYSVTTGDTLAQYGRVKSIDAQSGEITTSSGKVINYGQNDY